MQRQQDTITQINAVLAELIDETMHENACQRLLEIIADAAGYEFAFLVELEDDGFHMQVTSMHFPAGTLKELETITGFSLLGYSYPIELEAILTQPPTEVFTHFSDFHDSIPRKTGSSIGQAVGLKSIASIRQHIHDIYLGAVNFFATKSDPDLDLLETLCNNHLVYALRLMHEQRARARQNERYTAHLEQRVDERTAQLKNALAKSQAAEEQISEHYLNLVQTREELGMRIQEEKNLLEGLQALSAASSEKEIFTGSLNVLKGVFSYENAFILAKDESGKMHSLASTTSQFENLIWQPGSFFKRVMSGKTLVVFDNDFIPEWKAQTQQDRDIARSALYIPLVTQNTFAMLVCVHSSRGFFTKKHIQLAKRFFVIAFHSLKNAELYNQLRQERDSLEKIVAGRTADLVKLNKELLKENAERHLAERAVRESENRYRSLFEHTNDAVLFLSLDGKHLHANQQAADILGYDIDELMTLQIEDIVAPREYQDLQRVKASLLANENIPIYERIFRKKDGDEFPVEINIALAYDSEGQPIHIQIVVRDITERKRAQDEIVNLAKFPAENPDPVLRVTFTGEILYANPGSTQLLATWDCSQGQLLPVHVFELCLDEKGNPQKKLFELKIDDKTYALSFIPVREMGYINVYGRDITAEKKADITKTEFIASVSHELRTPLAAILGYTEILIDEEPGELNEIQTEFLNIIYESSNHLHRLVNDLLDVTKMESGHFELQLSQISLEQVIKKVTRYIKPVVEEKGVIFKIELPTVFPVLFADGSRIEQVLINLLSNAVKFSHQGGDVILKIEIKEGNQLVIQVIDTGMGIHLDDLPKLFDRFYRGNNVSGGNIQGTGLGLYITKTIIEGHHGQISVDSEIGKGSCFEVIIPI